MSYRALLGHIVLDDELPRRLAAMAEVARMFEAEMIGLGARAPWPFSDEHEPGGPSFQQLVRDARADIARVGDVPRAGAAVRPSDSTGGAR